jgi:O-antigen ligase
LAALQLERLAWLAADFVALMYILMRSDELLRLVRRNALLISWPILACVSMLWSEAAFISMYHGIQLLLTVLVGLCLCLDKSLERILVLLFLAYLATAICSVLWLVVNPGSAIQEGWVLGIFPHKNSLGSAMALMALTGSALFLAGWRPLISGPGVLLALALLVLAKSGTAIVALAIVMAASVAMASAVYLGRIGFSALIGIGLVAATAALLVLEVTQFDMFAFGLNALGKDETLTGRTVLWDFAMEAIDSRPWLGFGYKGWWESPHTDAQLLRIVMDQHLWFFHNTFLDLAVAFGVLGPTVLVVVLIFAVYRTVSNYLRTPDPILLWSVQYVVLMVIYCFVDFVLFTNHSLPQMLFVIAVAGQTLRQRSEAEFAPGHSAGTDHGSNHRSGTG